MNTIIFALIILLISFQTRVNCLSQYKVTKATQTPSSITLLLSYTGSDTFYIKPTSPIIQSLNFTIIANQQNCFSFKITDLNENRYQIPHGQPFPDEKFQGNPVPFQSAAFIFQYKQQPFNFRISRRVNNITIWSTYESNIIFSKHYLEIGTQLDSDYSYGIGQRFNDNLRLKSGKWSVFNIDRGDNIDHGTGLQTYGFYPFYLQRQNGNNFHLVYFRSSNALDAIKENRSNRHFLSWKTIGGILDFVVMIGQHNPSGLLKKFQRYIGKSIIPPFWSFGFHQSRYGYQRVSDLERVIQGYQANDIPLDTIWTDIDYMIEYEDFTIDQSRFPLDRMKKITDKYHYVPIIDAGIKVNDGKAYIEGKKRGVFVKDAVGQQYHGKVWPGTTTFVDFFHPNASSYWGEMLDMLYQKVNFSGIWLDMNQYANFCTGPCETPTHSGFDYSRDLPYTPGSTGNIESHTISLNATHYSSYEEADIHAFAGLLETQATYQYLKSKSLVPFIITRSSTFGSNKYGFHWTGDNMAKFQFLRGSIIDNFLNQFWGMQMVGADICGFHGNTTIQLCSRWLQLGSLYPFARNHNSNKAYDQQPYALGSIVLQSAKNNIKLRYSLLKHYFSLFVLSGGIGTIFSPLFLVFPQDMKIYDDGISNTEFMIGETLLCAPIIVENTVDRSAYFPQTNWTDLHTGKLYSAGTNQIKNNSLSDLVPIFLKSGTLILRQNTQKVRQTNDLLNNFEVTASLSYNQQYKDYRGQGKHISLSDYNNHSKIEICVREGCVYDISFVLKINGGDGILGISVKYSGFASFAESIWIDSVVLHYGGEVVRQVIDGGFEIKGTTETIVPIALKNNFKRSQDSANEEIKQKMGLRVQ